MKNKLLNFLKLFLIFNILIISNAFSEANKSLKIDTEKSYIKWVGNKVTGSHDGIVKLTSGEVTLTNLTSDIPKIESGNFKIDLTTITNKDIESQKYKKKLEDHLKSDDFFNVSKFPTSSFKITSSSIKDKELLINGVLSVKGISLPISFPAKIEKVNENYKALANLKINRTKWDIRYNSGSFFDPANLGDKLIYDDIEISLNIVTE